MHDLDYKKLALEGAALGAVAAFFLGTRRKNLGHFAKFAGIGAGVAVAGGFAMNELGGHKGLLAAKGEFTGWEDEGYPHHHHREYFRRW